MQSTQRGNLNKRLIEKRIVPVAVIESLEDAVPLARALASGGVSVIEVILRTPCALDCIRAIRRDCPEVLVGAGTVLNAGQVKAALEAGAQFGVSPASTRRSWQRRSKAGGFSCRAS
jgi:2-dehydro-3-deoxyphosphogluconate aldolase/(4S)-4-hydroxy-2-oxoglutarate aldolase